MAVGTREPAGALPERPVDQGASTGVDVVRVRSASAVKPSGRRSGGGDRLYVLDLLRFVAASSVLGFHVFADIRGAWGTEPARLFGTATVGVFRYGWLGVEFFFVISGFVICMSCWGRSLSGFFVSRVTRLAPAYVFAVAVTSTVLRLLPLPGGRPKLSDVLVNATMLQRFVGVPDIDDVYWTLFVELKFYVFFSVVVYFGLTYRRVLGFCAGWTLLYLFAAYCGFRPLILVVDPSFGPYFVAGIVLYLMYRFGPTLLLWGLLALSVVMSMPVLVAQVAAHNTHGRVNSFPVTFAVMVCFYTVMVAVALRWLSWLRWRGLFVLGTLTYPVYLLHRELSRVAVGRLHGFLPPWLLLAALLAGVLGLAFATHRLVERPAAKVLREGLDVSFAQIRRGDQQRDAGRTTGALSASRRSMRGASTDDVDDRRS
jgi:peptidoglycan/LPS O-acetylase OafA/YrhL